MGRRTVAERRVVPVGELCIMQIARADRARGFLLRQRIKKSSGREKSDPPLGSSRLAPSRGEHRLTLQKMQIRARARAMGDPNYMRNRHRRCTEKWKTCVRCRASRHVNPRVKIREAEEIRSLARRRGEGIAIANLFRSFIRDASARGLRPDRTCAEAINFKAV